jgi:hypothetical protein
LECTLFHGFQLIDLPRETSKTRNLLSFLLALQLPSKSPKIYGPYVNLI